MSNEAYAAIGFLVVTNLSSVFGMLKGVWFIARLELRVERLEKDVNEAFRIIKQKQGVSENA